MAQNNFIFAPKLGKCFGIHNMASCGLHICTVLQFVRHIVLLKQYNTFLNYQNFTKSWFQFFVVSYIFIERLYYWNLFSFNRFVLMLLVMEISILNSYFCYRSVFDSFYVHLQTLYTSVI